MSVPEIFLPRSTCHKGLPKSFWREVLGEAEMEEGRCSEKQHTSEVPSMASDEKGQTGASREAS